jgi:hypothetical protein
MVRIPEGFWEDMKYLRKEIYHWDDAERDYWLERIKEDPRWIDYFTALAANWRQADQGVTAPMWADEEVEITL